MEERKFSELPSAASLTGNELAALSQMQSGSLASVKSTLQAIANWFAVYAQYTTALQTTDKSIAGAINELKQLISLIPQFSIEVVQVLPTEDISDTTIYLVPAEDPEVGNYYEEYIHVNNTWELVGTTAVDLSAYYTKLEVDGLLADKLDADDFEANQTASANPITLETKQAGLARSCVVEMNPIQDLHGYDYPWVGGAGKNKSSVNSVSGVAWAVPNADLKNSFNSLQNGTYTISFNIKVKTVTSTGEWIYGFIAQNPDGNISKMNTVTTDATVGDEGSIVYTFTITDANRGAFTNVNLYGCGAWVGGAKGTSDFSNIQIELGNQATSFAPYSNICPIIGRTETNIVQGRNSTNMYKDTGVIPFNSNTAGVEFHGDNSLRVYAKTSNTYQASKQYLSNYSNLENGKKYAIFANAEIKSGIALIGVRNSANSIISGPVTIMTTSGTCMCTFTMSSEASFISFFCTWDTANINADVKYTNIRFVEYEKLITKEFGQTVIGGRLDFENGGLDNEYELFEPTIVTTVAQSSGLWYWAFSLPKTSTNPLSTNGLMSSHFNPTNQVLAIGNCYITENGTLLLCVPADQTLNTGTLVNEWLSENDLQFAYKPATATKSQLSPEAVTLLKGLNVISTDGDKVQVEFSDIPVGDYSVLLDYIKSLEARIAAVEP